MCQQVLFVIAIALVHNFSIVSINPKIRKLVVAWWFPLKQLLNKSLENTTQGMG